MDDKASPSPKDKAMENLVTIDNIVIVSQDTNASTTSLGDTAIDVTQETSKKFDLVAETDDKTATDFSNQPADLVEQKNCEKFVEDIQDKNKTNHVAEALSEITTDAETTENQTWTKLVQQLVNSVEKTSQDLTLQEEQEQQEIVVILDKSQNKEEKIGTGDVQCVIENGNEKEDSKKVVVITNKQAQASLKPDVEMESLEFRCWYCEKLFDTNRDREDHEKIHTESRSVLLICQQCGQSFQKSEEFEAHHQSCSVNNDAGESFNDTDGDLHSSYSDENSNSYSDAQPGSYECVLCERHFGSKESVKKHLILRHQLVEDNKHPKWYSCKYCDENLPDRKLILQHESKHNARISLDDKAGKFPCAYCGRRCQSRSNLIEHQRMHTGEKPYSCPHCGKSCSRERDVKEHIKRMHLGNVGKQLTCEYCYVIFVTRKDLIDHLQDIHNVKKLPMSSIPDVNDTNYICSECGKEFDNKARRQFEEHIATHTRDNLFTCDECGKTFVRARELRYHKARHRGEGRYVCGLCRKNFVLKWDLKKHLKTIHDIDEDGSFDRPPEKKTKMNYDDDNMVMDDIVQVNPYICRICHAQFDGGKELRAHRKTHVEEDGENAKDDVSASFPYICSFCSKGFQDKNDFVEHVGTHTKGTFETTKYRRILSKEVPLPEIAVAASPPAKRGGKRGLEKGEGVDYWKCCYGPCLKVMKVYSTKEEFVDHIKQHMAEHTNICDYCGRCFARTRDLTYHKKESGVRPCKYMNIPTRDELSVEQVKAEDSQTLNMDSVTPFSNLSLSKKLALITSKADAISGSTDGTALQSDTIWHKCGCNKKIQGYKEFQLHVLSHKSTAGKEYCQYCGKSFTDQDFLKEHLKETDDNPCKYAPFALNGQEPVIVNGDDDNGDHVNDTKDNSDQASTSKPENRASNGLVTAAGNGGYGMNMVFVQPVKLELAKTVTILPANIIPTTPVYVAVNKMAPSSLKIDKPYACSFCGKAFRARSYVREHETLHTKEANFVCEVCDRKFTRARELRYHMKKHLGDEPFVCKICKKRFLNHGHFTTHMEKEHEAEITHEAEPKVNDTEDNDLGEDESVNLADKSFKCTFCSKHFTHLDHFKAHMEIVHDVEVSVVNPDEILNEKSIEETTEETTKAMTEETKKS